MNKEILKQNILHVVKQPCIESPWDLKCTKIATNGLSRDGQYIMLKVRPDDTSWKCILKDSEGNDTDFVENILNELPYYYRDHLVTIKHDTWVSYSYVPVFDTDTQEKWDSDFDTFVKAKQSWCDRYGCD